MLWEAAGGSGARRSSESPEAGRPREAALPTAQGPCLLGVVLALWTLPASSLDTRRGGGRRLSAENESSFPISAEYGRPHSQNPGAICSPHGSPYLQARDEVRQGAGRKEAGTLVGEAWGCRSQRGLSQPPSVVTEARALAANITQVH